MKIRHIASLLVVLASGFANAAPQRQAVDARKLDPRIGPPVRAKYQDLREARLWYNPAITITAEGIEVRSIGIPGGRRTIASTELRALLVELPIEAWPYGRVVMASDIGLRSVRPGGGLDENEERSIGRNHREAERILRLLEIEADWWPS